MSRKRRFKNKIIFICIVFVLIIYFVHKLLFNINTEIVQLGDMQDVINTKGYIVKDEIVQKLEVKGNVVYLYKEGDKVYKDVYVASVTNTQGIEEINSNISMINKTLSDINNNKVIIVGINEQNKYFTYSKDELVRAKEILDKVKTNNKVEFYSPMSGIISYNIDGLESVLNIKSLYNLSPEKLDECMLQFNNTKDKSIENEAFKVINNFEYYIVCKIPKDKSELFVEDDRVIITMNDDLDKFYGTVCSKKTFDSSDLLFIKFNDSFYKLYDKRVKDINILTNKYEGIKINKKAVIVKDGLKGVFIKDISNIIRFFPVEILSEDKLFYIVSEGNKISSGNRGIIVVNDEKYYTIKTFDKVVLNPSKVYEGEIIQ